MRTRRLVAADLTRKHWSEKTATRVLTAWRESAMSLSAFARANGVNAQRLSWWRKRLENAGAGAPAATVAPLTFITATLSGLARVTVRLPGGVEVEGDVAAIQTGWVVALARELGKA
jgi:transposase-like protein